MKWTGKSNWSVGETAFLSCDVVKMMTSLVSNFLYLTPHKPSVGAFVAGIYVTVGWSMSSLAAFGWGIGLSLTSLVLTTLISCVPMYPFL